MPRAGLPVFHLMPLSGNRSSKEAKTLLDSCTITTRFVSRCSHMLPAKSDTPLYARKTDLGPDYDSTLPAM